MKIRPKVLPFLALGLLPSVSFAAAAPAKKPVVQPAPKSAPKPNPKPAAKPVLKPKPKPKPVLKPKPKPIPKPKPQIKSAPPETVEAPREAPKYATWALLVGVSKYLAPQVSSLRYPSIDASGIRDALVDSKLGNVPAENIKLLTDENATRENILGAVDSFLKPNVKAGDHVIVFLAGHGVAKGVGTTAKSFLLPTDVKGLSTAALESSAVDLKELSTKLSALPAAQFVQFVDACREDPTPGRAGKPNTLTDVLSRGVHIVPQGEERASSVTFFACAPGQRAFEDEKLNHGVFTYWILDGIRAAAIPQKPDGAVDMGRLSTYVSTKVGDWAKEASNNGDFEIAQTPEMIATESGGATAPVVLMRVSRTLPETPIPAGAAKLTVISLPDGAQVSIDGTRVGVAPLAQDVAAGAHTLLIKAPGYDDKTVEVQAMAGYPQRLEVQLVPQGSAANAATIAKSNELFARALDAETRQNWRDAESSYAAILAGDIKFAPAYENLADLQNRQGRNRDALNTLLRMGANTPATAHAYSLVSQGFSTVALQGDGTGNTDSQRAAAGPFKTPEKPGDAANYALVGANAAIKADANSAESNRALGRALLVNDQKGARKSEALAALRKAVAAAPQDATNSFALGLGIRFFAQFSAEAAAKTELASAIEALREATRLRPDYYDAHRELAYCLHLTGDTDGAIREYELANANRGAARDSNEVAGNSVALAALHEKRAQNSTGSQKKRDSEASAGYMDDARETSKDDLAAAVKVLGMIGLKTQLTDFLPPEFRQFLDIKSMINNRIQNEIGNKIKIPRIRF